MKKALIAVGTLTVIVIVAFFFVWKNLDAIVKTAIETYGSEATKTAVHVAAVKLDLKDGQATITGLSVANPKGFTDPHIFELGRISTRVDTASINKNPIIIDEIHISAPAVVYEINRAGVSNVEVLKKNLGLGSGSQGSSSGSERRMIIRKIIVDGSSAKVRIAALNQAQSVSLPRIVMTDVGAKSGGATAAEVARQLSDRMLANVKGSVAKIGVDKYLGKTADAVKAQMQKHVGGTAGGMLKGLLGQ
jgi:hypothetical protein